jgi:roadblock/LC7 domain-containing protein
MPALDELMSLPGVYGAIEFSCTGELGQMRGDVERDFAELVAQMCAANMAIYRMQATGWTKLTGQKGFLPERGFTFVTLDHVVMGMNGNAVLAHGKDFDYDAAYRLFNAAV